MLLKPEFTLSKLRRLRSGRHRQAAQKALALDCEDLEAFVAQDNGDIGIALVDLEWYLSALEALGVADPSLSDLRTLVTRENTL